MNKPIVTDNNTQFPGRDTVTCYQSDTIAEAVLLLENTLMRAYGVSAEGQKIKVTVAVHIDRMEPR